MNKFILIASATILSFGIANESQADNSATQNQETQNLLPDEGNCGVGCKYKITEENGKRNLVVYNDPNYTGVSNINNNAFTSTYTQNGKTYKFYDNAKFDKITIDGDFDTIGNEVFSANDAKEVIFNGSVNNIGIRAFAYNALTSVNLPEGLTSIKSGAFFGNQISSIIIPDSITNIIDYAFHGGQIKSIIIPDTLKFLGTYYPFGSGQRPEIICRGEVKKCQSLVKKYHMSDSSITTDLSNYVIAATYENCNTANYFWNGASCVREPDVSKRKCCTTCKDMGGWCNRIRYTPAEAAKVLRDDNTNSVTITFKK